MKYFDHTRAGALRRRTLGGAMLLACALLPASASARQATTPAAAPVQAPAPNAPATTPAAQAPQSAPPRAPRVNVTPRAPMNAPARVTVQRAPVATPAVPPRQVVTVVHRLTGWKLLAWLATSGPPAVELDELPSTTDAHTNIVAGYIHDDGRTVVARLPQADIDLEAFTVPRTPPAFFARSAAGFDPEPEYMLVTADNRRVEARLVGIDSSTGLTLLEATKALLSDAPAGDQGDTEDPTVGQRVRLYAPAPAAAPGARTPPAATPGYILVSIDQKEGLLTEVSRAPSGRPSRVVVSADDVSQAWTGAVAANELGEVVGIISQGRDGETHLVPMAAVRSACERVLRLRGNAPQPWLGARADAALQSSLDAWVKLGWTPETARPLIENRRGVFLTSVAPGTPAALAGLKPGDLISGVGAREVRGAEDFSMTLKEAGVGSTVDMTVWRALEPSPVKVTVELKGVRNPALATAVAEEGALREAVLASSREVREMRAEQSRLRNDPRGANAAELTRLGEQLGAAEARLAVIGEQLELVRAKVSASRSPASGLPVRQPPAQLEGYMATLRLQSYGLNALGLTQKGASRLGARGGMLVVAVRPESPAAASGLVAGDVIETVNGMPLLHTELRRLLAVPEPSALTFGLVREGRRLTVSFSPSYAGEPRQR
jgi:S1-C subfamily serine protease